RGARARLGPVPLQIGPVRVVPPRSGPQVYDFVSSRYYSYGLGYGPGRSWRVVIGAAGRTAMGPLRFQILDSDGHPILYVDSEGRPVPDDVYEKWRKAAPGLMGRVPQYDLAQCNAGGPETPDAFTAIFNVDPKYIGALKVTALKQRHVTITGFPLEPR
ncbi:MAG TPA: hypothetical protein VMI31_06370, partial [Fimbriimonadaceae bacterium]|nr:hypothetical protein [Fimbriimonadaceae bacterium]